jgi:hypothetical protein
MEDTMRQPAPQPLASPGTPPTDRRRAPLSRAPLGLLVASGLLAARLIAPGASHILRLLALLRGGAAGRRPVKRLLLWPVAALGPLVAAAQAVATFPGRRDQGPVFSVAQLQALAAHDPAAWVGRTVRVRAIPAGGRCLAAISTYRPDCDWRGPALLDTRAQDAVEPLPLVRGSASPLLALLRRLPLAGRGPMGSQALRWDTPGIYQVQLSN